MKASRVIAAALQQKFSIKGSRDIKHRSQNATRCLYGHP